MRKTVSHKITTTILLSLAMHGCIYSCKLSVYPILVEDDTDRGAGGLLPKADGLTLVRKCKIQ